jgi:hypothetical protein
MDGYKNKYLKYKNKYINLKNNNMKGGMKYISDGITYIQNSIKSVTMTEEQIINQKELEAVKLENKTRFIDAAEYKKTILENAYNTAIQNAEKIMNRFVYIYLSYLKIIMIMQKN